jgi:hypothetical protein
MDKKYDLILALQKELGSVRKLPEDIVYVKNALAILSAEREKQKKKEKK